MARLRSSCLLLAGAGALLAGSSLPAAGQVSGLGLAGDALVEMDNVQALPDAAGRGRRLVIGDGRGVVHVYEQRGRSYDEIWASRYLEGSICGIQVIDINDDGLLEIVACTDRGRIHYLDAENYNTVWTNSPGEYQQISAMLAANVDDDPQPELILCADGRLVIYDGRDQFEEWRSEQTGLTTTSMLVADVDGDAMDEIVLNDGYVFSARVHTLEWQFAEGFGERMGALDLDGDGILELISEYRSRFIRLFDVDLRREKSLRANY